MTTNKWVTGLWPWDPVDPEAFLVVTSTLVDLSLMAERKIDDARSHRSSRQDRREEQDSPPRSQAGASGVTQGGHAEERPQGPPVPRDQVPRSPEDQTLYSGSGVTRFMLSLLRESIRLTQMFLMHSQVILRNMILLMLNTKRWTGLWLKECSIHQKLKDGLPRRLTLS